MLKYAVDGRVETVGQKTIPEIQYLHGYMHRTLVPLWTNTWLVCATLMYLTQTYQYSIFLSYLWISHLRTF
jgi:hypothetical protein